MIIAPTDARAAIGFDEPVDRSNAYAEAGADMIFFEGPTSEDELRQVLSMVRVPVLANMISGGGLTPLLTAQELEAMGYKLVNFGVASQQAAMQAVAGLYDDLMRTGTTAGYQDRMMSFNERQRTVGLPEIMELEKRFATSASTS